MLAALCGLVSNDQKKKKKKNKKSGSRHFVMFWTKKSVNFKTLKACLINNQNYNCTNGGQGNKLNTRV